MSAGNREARTATAAQTRDLLGRTCFTLHFAVMIYIVTGWLAPSQAALLVYMVFLALVVFQWEVNKNACMLNNIESWLRTRRWRDPGNREEGAWLATLCENTLGYRPSAFFMNVFTRVLLLALWLVALGHMLYWRA